MPSQFERVSNGYVEFPRRRKVSVIKVISESSLNKFSFPWLVPPLERQFYDRLVRSANYLLGFWYLKLWNPNDLQSINYRSRIQTSTALLKWVYLLFFDLHDLQTFFSDNLPQWIQTTREMECLDNTNLKSRWWLELVKGFTLSTLHTLLSIREDNEVCWMMRTEVLWETVASRGLLHNRTRAPSWLSFPLITYQ